MFEFAKAEDYRPLHLNQYSYDLKFKKKSNEKIEEYKPNLMHLQTFR